jgi:hypothetical protein
MDVKIVTLPTKTCKTEKPKKNRVVTHTKRWQTHVQTDDFDPIQQCEWLQHIEDDSEKSKLMKSQIHAKIKGYKSQDVQKAVYDPDKFVSFDGVISKLRRCDLLCFYCREPCAIWYEQSRYPKQWSLERIDNDFGHNDDNVEIACLSCNIKRRCMYHERFRFTKQMKFVKKDENET